MEKVINIQPITRIEGHAKVAIHLDDTGNVADTYLHVQSFRGFEKFCVDGQLKRCRVLSVISAGSAPGRIIWLLLRPVMPVSA